MENINIGSKVKLYTWKELCEIGYKATEEEGFREEMHFENVDVSIEFFEQTDMEVEHEIVWVDEDKDFKIIKDNYTLANEMIKEVISF